MTTTNFRNLFLIDSDVIYLNHGSFGACPKPVFEAYQHWQLELERQPVNFFANRMAGLMADSRHQLGEYLGTSGDNLVYITNATQGVNTIARSLKLQAGDEILTTDHEYGACDSALQFVCDLVGAKMVRQHLPLPLPSDDEIMETIWSGVTPRTKLLFLSHITSPTAVIFPVEGLIQRARNAGILTLIDGAHVPGQIDLDLDALGADFYTGNCHKWMCTPKGSAFLYVHPDRQAEIHPLTISWGYNRPGIGHTTEADFITRHEMQGTLDPARWLSIPAAIEFMKAHDWSAMREERHTLAVETQQRLCDLTDSIIPVRDDAYAQMCISPMPVDVDVPALKKRLIDDYRIEIPLPVWNNRPFVRASFQIYNTREDADALVNAVAELLQVR